MREPTHVATANITRTEAEQRSAVVRVTAYSVLVDVSGYATDEPTKTFASRTHIELSAEGPATHLDLIAESVTSATLDGQPIPLEGFDGYRLPLPAMEPGKHTVVVDAVCRYSITGEGLHRFVDPSDDKVYLYSQFETADARRMFANFEQPDQKATFQLSVIAPSHWVVISNSARVEPVQLSEGVSRWDHVPTPPVSTYITALVAGEYHVAEGEIRSAAGVLPASVACRASMAEFLDADRIRETAQRGFEVFEDAFGVPYAFDSYDQIFVPEFNAGAMENAGCVTFRDEYLFRYRVTAREMESRDNTILHELAHMWFGDLVTMAWWDDLWLNESFAEWASHFAADEISRRYDTGADPWASFSNERKAWAYLQDQLSTTHPIAADMGDLEKVEQNFDGITYAKGASVLKLLVSFVGTDAFRAGVSEYFAKHAWGSTTLRDLLVELEAASGRDLSWFTGQWLETAGVNTLRADFDADEDGLFTRFAVLQTASPDFPTLRRHRLAIGIFTLTDGELRRTHAVELDIDGPSTEIDDMVGVHRGDVVLINDGDLTYAKVRFDPASAAVLVNNIEALRDPLARAVTWSSFWDSVRDGDIAPQDFVTLALRGIDSETDMAATATVLSQAAVCTGRFMAPELRQEANVRLTAGLARLLQRSAPGSDKQVMIAKSLVASARSDQAVELIRGWLNDEEVPAGLSVDTGMRWAIVSSLARVGAIDASVIDEEFARDNTSAGAERAAGAKAGLPDAAQKAEAWRLATEDPEVPNETHRSIAMGFWHFGQEELTSGYADAYLEMARDISAREGMWAERGYAAIGTVLRWLFPDPLISDELVERFDGWLTENSPTQQVLRSITERLDEARRALRCQASSRVAARPE
ncbi:MAG: aminopeptidase N [Propionibacteriaceae bacterium]|nr:aminopeptidase N [Propionibacteriaceae bacterium]